MKKLLRMEKSGWDVNNYASSGESDIEPVAEEVTLPQNYLGGHKGSKIGIKLNEIGPRMTLKLVKMEEGHCSGNVVYHSFI